MVRLSACIRCGLFQLQLRLTLIFSSTFSFPSVPSSFFVIIFFSSSYSSLFSKTFDRIYYLFYEYCGKSQSDLLFIHTHTHKCVCACKIMKYARACGCVRVYMCKYMYRCVPMCESCINCLPCFWQKSFFWKLS